MRKIFFCTHVKHSLKGKTLILAFVHSHISLQQKFAEDGNCIVFVEYSCVEQICSITCSVYKMKPVLVHGEDF